MSAPKKIFICFLRAAQFPGRMEERGEKVNEKRKRDVKPYNPSSLA